MIPDNLKEIQSYYPNSPLTRLDDPWLDAYAVEIYIKRDDLIDRRISGNKFRKLKYALTRYHNNSYSGIVSFGGAWSNHLHALSAVAEKYKIPTVAIIRGEQPKNPSSTLKDILRSGTHTHFVSRDKYRVFRTLAEHSKLEQHPFFKQWSNHMIIPEGGCSTDALLGVADIVSEDTQAFNAVYLACGTGATLAGLSLGLVDTPETKLVGIAALRAGTSLQDNVVRLLADHGMPYSKNWKIEDDFHFGGFAKASQTLLDFMISIHQRTGLVTEPVYTAKCLFALYQHIQQGRFSAGSKIKLIHTGGLQGLRGYRGKGIDHLVTAAGFS